MLRAITLLLMLLLAACSPSSAPVELTSLPPGDASRGAALFTQSINTASACVTCHTTDDTTLIGPSLKGFAARASSQVAEQNATAYAFNSITKPAQFLVSGFPNAMYNNYAAKLSAQDIADLIAYLLTL